jgi:hypothetical protein
VLPVISACPGSTLGSQQSHPRGMCQISLFTISEVIETIVAFMKCSQVLHAALFFPIPSNCFPHFDHRQIVFVLLDLGAVAFIILFQNFTQFGLLFKYYKMIDWNENLHCMSMFVGQTFDSLCACVIWSICGSAP